VAISLYRQENQRSPAGNFGRMLLGYQMSSSNDAKLASTGKWFRGGPTTEQDASHLPGIPPVGPLEGDPDSQDWCGHAWSEWMAVGEALSILPPEAIGLYRLRVSGQAELLYIGQGLVRARLLAHLLERRAAGAPPKHFLCRAAGVLVGRCLILVATPST
jgi:hypothetical protein